MSSRSQAISDKLSRQLTEIGETFVAQQKNDFGMLNSQALVRHLLHQKVQGQIGRIGVHPSSPIQQQTYLKVMKLIALTVFRIETRHTPFATGNPLHEMGRKLGYRRSAATIRPRHFNCT